MRQDYTVFLEYRSRGELFVTLFHFQKLISRPYRSKNERAILDQQARYNVVRTL